MTNQLDELLEAGVAKGAVPGVVAAIVNRNEMTYLGAAGERSIGTGAAMTTDTVGAIFSMTKAITGAAAMQLVEQGKVDLDAPAGNYCPELAEPATVLEGFDADGQPITRPAVGDVTLRNLLTHTSGYVYDIWNADMGRWYEATETPTLFSLMIDALKTPLAFDPGTQWEYGIGIDWAGILIERVTGMTLGAYFADHLTGPLGMNDTAFAHTEDMLARASAVHARLPDGGFVAMDLPAAEAPEFEMGGGGLHSTMTDYGRFMRMTASSTVRECSNRRPLRRWSPTTWATCGSKNSRLPCLHSPTMPKCSPTSQSRGGSPSRFMKQRVRRGAPPEH